MGRMKDYLMTVEEEMYRYAEENGDPMPDFDEVMEEANNRLADFKERRREMAQDAQLFKFKKPLSKVLTEDEMKQATQVAQGEGELTDELFQKLLAYYQGTGEMSYSVAGEDLYAYITEQLTKDLQ